MTAAAFVWNALLGWLCESTYMTWKSKRWTNRGLMRGPWILAYGCAAFLKPLAGEPIVVFVLAATLIAVVKEGLNLIAALWSHVRWQQGFHLSAVLAYGVFGLAMVYVIPEANPYLGMLWIVMAADLIYTLYRLTIYRHLTEGVQKDLKQCMDHFASDQDLRSERLQRLRQDVKDRRDQKNEAFDKERDETAYGRDDLLQKVEIERAAMMYDAKTQLASIDREIDKLDDRKFSTWMDYNSDIRELVGRLQQELAQLEQEKQKHPARNYPDFVYVEEYADAVERAEALISEKHEKI
ncbi:putative ABC transporter permease [Catenisphaera adipataccumulans]|jgi:hypothetical protein|uniref:Uncharacterized protein n=1 Tax=Catenisphaera adipataccumulans TaxID=700500 RepID=A0A7W8FW77_9FIRM|nr:putative ABC transporter permease [Catenisphaera adipataccumulans]MBB5182410.1 hypothetical protein [Catenisphaera adipataccumulans]